MTEAINSEYQVEMAPSVFLAGTLIAGNKLQAKQPLKSALSVACCEMRAGNFIHTVYSSCNPAKLKQQQKKSFLWSFADNFITQNMDLPPPPGGHTLSAQLYISLQGAIVCSSLPTRSTNTQTIKRGRKMTLLIIKQYAIKGCWLENYVGL